MFKVIGLIFFSLFILSCSNDLNLKDVKCISDSECPSDAVCVKKICVLKTELTECPISKQCSEVDLVGYKCDIEIGRCIDNTCTGNEDCIDEALCLPSRFCDSTGKCSDVKVCQDAKTCENDSDCDEPTPTCNQGVCVKEKCEIDDDCNDPTPICNLDGVCVKEKCELECGEGSDCVIDENGMHCTCDNNGDTRCLDNGNELQTCRDNLWVNENCGSNQECKPNASGASCDCSEGYEWDENDKNCITKDLICTPNEKKCDTNILKTCNKDGNDWLDNDCTQESHKTCGAGSNGPACICELGYKGENCNVCIDGYHKDRNDCIEDLHIPCDWTTEFCSVDNKFILKCESNNVVKTSCGDNEVCVDDGSTVSCAEEITECSDANPDGCDSNTINKICNANTCVECVAAGDCMSNNETCDIGGDTPTYKCICMLGFHDEQGVCVQDTAETCSPEFVNSCKVNDSNADCSMTDTGNDEGVLYPECICSEGFMEQMSTTSITCTETTGACAGGDVNCGDNGTCRNERITYNSITYDYRCVCAEGYKKESDIPTSECVECRSGEIECFLANGLTSSRKCKSDNTWESPSSCSTTCTEGIGCDDVDPPIESWNDISLGGYFTCGINSGKLYCWGINKDGELGIGDTSALPLSEEDDRGCVGGAYTTCNKPVKVGSDSTWTSISAGQYSICGIKNGEIYCWGKLGGNSIKYQPDKVESSLNWIKVSHSDYHTCAIDSNNKLYCWGLNGKGQLGIGNTDNKTTPTVVEGSLLWKDVVAGNEYTCGIDNSNFLYCWGNNYYGQLGLGDSGIGTERDTPTKVIVTTATYWRSVALGDSYSCAIDSVNKLYCWGYNTEKGQLGIGSDVTLINAIISVPYILSEVSTYLPYLNFYATSKHTCSIKNTGELYCWGDNESYQLGIGELSNTVDCSLGAYFRGYCFNPVKVDGGLTSWSKFATGGRSTCGINNNQLYCWGNGQYGQTGLGNNNPVKVPTLVSIP